MPGRAYPGPAVSFCRDMARAERDPDKRKALEDIAASWEDICEKLIED
jgi:hypothetical protein